MIQQHITSGAAQICPRLRSYARRSITSRATWDLIRGRRATRRELHAQCNAIAQECLRRCFRAWGGLRPDSVDVHFQRLHAAFLAMQIRGLSRRIVGSAKSDVASSARAIFADARAAGPEALSRLLRSTLKAGRKYRQPHLAPALIQDGQVVEDSEARIGAHFAAAERAQLVDPAELFNSPPPLEETTLEACLALSLPSVAHAFGKLSAKKAPGFSGLPADVLRFAPVQAAACHMPLLVKILMRQQVPLLWKGGRAVPIEKPGKNLALPSGWRSILLLEAGAKGLGGALRQCLLSGFETLRMPGQGGSRPKAPMQTAMALIQGFIWELKLRHRSRGESSSSTDRPPFTPQSGRRLLAGMVETPWNGCAI